LNNNPEFIVVGKFGRTKGVSGEIYINPLTDNPERFKKNIPFWIEDKGEWKKLRIDSVNLSSARPILRLKGIDTPEQAGELTNKFLYVKYSELERLPDGRYYHFDLLGCRVEDTNGKLVGQVFDVEEYPANDILVIKSESKRKYNYPLVRQFVREIKAKDKVIIVEPPGDIFDESDEN
jgi:16S rRNA processing protein RimM